MECIDLKRTFGDRFKVAYEESYHAEYGPNAHREDAWLMILLCQHGHISPWGRRQLAACTDKAGPIAKRLRELPFVDRNASQDGSEGINAVFDVTTGETPAATFSKPVCAADQ